MNQRLFSQISTLLEQHVRTLSVQPTHLPQDTKHVLADQEFAGFMLNIEQEEVWQEQGLAAVERLQRTVTAMYEPMFNKHPIQEHFLLPEDCVYTLTLISSVLVGHRSMLFPPHIAWHATAKMAHSAAQQEMTLDRLAKEQSDEISVLWIALGARRTGHLLLVNCDVTNAHFGKIYECSTAPPWNPPLDGDSICAENMVDFLQQWS